MSRKAFAQVSVLILILLAFLAIPGSAQAGGACGSTYIVQWGDTLDVIAWRCGTSVSALYAANPGLSGYLYAGQVLMMPGGYYCNCPPVSYSGTYIVQPGDTFSGIASRFRVSIYDLWAANPHIWNINVIYAGQVIYVPTSAGQVVYAPAPAAYAPAPAGQPVYGSASAGEIYGTASGQVVYIPPSTGQVYYAPGSYTIVPTPTAEPVPLSYGEVPPGAPYGSIRLSNKAKADVYVSLQGTTRDGFNVINEYPVSGTFNVKIPAAWYNYVAWVGGKKFQGGFHLGGDSDHTITFYSNKVVVDE